MSLHRVQKGNLDYQDHLWYMSTSFYITFIMVLFVCFKIWDLLLCRAVRVLMVYQGNQGLRLFKLMHTVVLVIYILYTFFLLFIISVIKNMPMWIALCIIRLLCELTRCFIITAGWPGFKRRAWSGECTNILFIHYYICSNIRKRIFVYTGVWVALRQQNSGTVNNPPHEWKLEK